MTQWSQQWVILPLAILVLCNTWDRWIWIIPFKQYSFNNIKLLSQAVRFYSSLNLTIRDIQIQNSPRCHLKFDNCAGVKVTNLSISSPGDSPNTDGIHLQNSQRVEVENSTISCGITLDSKPSIFPYIPDNSSSRS